jgi:hypothetical protein
MSSDPSMEWVRRAGDYRVLVGKRDRLGQPLAAEDEARLAELSRFFMQDANRRRLPWAHREQIRASISIVVQFENSVGEARDISPEGIFVVTERPLAVGTRTVIRVSDGPVVHANDDVDATYDEWQFAAEVVRVEGGGMGLRFDGIPLSLRISGRRAATLPQPARHADAA